MRYKIIVSLLAGVPAVLLAFSTGPPVRRTGAAVDGGLNCTACHVTFAPANSDPAGSVSISFDTPGYTPGVMQMVHVTVKHPLAKRWGFQLSPRPVNNQTIPAGTLGVTDVVRVRCDTTPASDSPCNGALEFAEHKSAPITDVGAGYTFDIPWTPPATDVGDVIFYFAGNAANDDGTPLNDRIYTSAKTISNASACTSAPAVKPVISGIANGTSGQPAWASNTILSIFGSGFAAGNLNRSVTPGDIAGGAYPQQLACVAVEINGQRSPITYVQGSQINVQAPTLAQTGPATVTVVINPGTPAETRSSTVSINTQQTYAPAFFTFGSTSIAALSTTGSVIADPSVLAGGRFAKPGDVISLYGTGFGATNPPVASGMLASSAATITAPLTVMLNGVALPPAAVLYAGLSPGSISCLYQINVQIPLNTPSGNIPLTVMAGGIASPSGTTIPIKSGQ
jgi:uncharacterized protein (TIGR03437 family)